MATLTWLALNSLRSLLTGSLLLFLGYIGPALSSAKAIHSMDEDSLTEWITYWIVLSLFYLFENIIDFMLWKVPFYSELKIAMICWLTLPGTQGAFKTYHLVIKPYYEKHEKVIDQHIDAAAGKIRVHASNALSELMWNLLKGTTLEAKSALLKLVTKLLFLDPTASSSTSSSASQAGMSTGVQLDTLLAGLQSEAGIRVEVGFDYSFYVVTMQSVNNQHIRLSFDDEKRRASSRVRSLTSASASALASQLSLPSSEMMTSMEPLTIWERLLVERGFIVIPLYALDTITQLEDFENGNIIELTLSSSSSADPIFVKVEFSSSSSAGQGEGEGGEVKAWQEDCRMMVKVLRLLESESRDVVKRKLRRLKIIVDNAAALLAMAREKEEKSVGDYFRRWKTAS